MVVKVTEKVEEEEMRRRSRGRSNACGGDAPQFRTTDVPASNDSLSHECKRTSERGNGRGFLFVLDHSSTAEAANETSRGSYLI